MKLNKVETMLYTIASLMVALILYLTYIGYQNGGYEQNPVLRLLFETIYSYTGNWAISILSFVPIAIAGLYIAIVLIKRDYQDKNPRAGQIILTALILLITPTLLNNTLNLRLDNRLIAISGIILTIIYLLYEWQRPKITVKSLKKKR